MKRPNYVADEYYHLFNRGRSRLAIFHDSGDYRFALANMKKYSRKFKLEAVRLSEEEPANTYHA